MKSSDLLVNVWRGPLIESIHRGHIAVVNYKGVLLHSLGDPELHTFARSTAKLIQALPVIESGAADRFGFTDAELALLCASHNGEEQHVDTAASILGKLGLSAEHLQCGVHEPLHQPTSLSMRASRVDPTSLHNNCSGKHSGMLALAVHRQTPHEHYLSIGHPIQKEMLDAVSDLCNLSSESIHIGVDGCGVPVFGMCIDRLALAYARLGYPEGLSESRANACNRIIQAIQKHPHYLAGTDRFDTRLAEITQGRIIGKMGAEGVFAITVPDSGVGIVIKIEDGNQRALYPTAVEVLKQLNFLTASEVMELSSFHMPAIHNWQGTEVGRIRPDFRLCAD
jgi:L-asparaginase II